jgi:LPXTG-motif cell wall-anchored protein
MSKYVEMAKSILGTAKTTSGQAINKAKAIFDNLKNLKELRSTRKDYADLLSVAKSRGLSDAQVGAMFNTYKGLNTAVKDTNKAMVTGAGLLGAGALVAARRKKQEKPLDYIEVSPDQNMQVNY